MPARLEYSKLGDTSNFGHRNPTWKHKGRTEGYTNVQLSAKEQNPNRPQRVGQRTEETEVGHQACQIHSGCFSKGTQSSVVGSQLCGDDTWTWWGALAALEEWSLQEEYVQQQREIRDGRAME